MGMSTEVFANFDLKENTPADVIHVLETIQDKTNPFYGLFFNCSYYTPNTQICKLTYDKNAKFYSFIGKGDLKYPFPLVENFFIFFMPWIYAEEGTFIGYYRYEKDLSPTLIRKI